ncbi:MAG: ComEA family DNA-binding protein [Micrococcales bacterium]|nr:ComEA family DNA-binding protein [Micrococcales bacterium]
MSEADDVMARLRLRASLAEAADPALQPKARSSGAVGRARQALAMHPAAGLGAALAVVALVVGVGTWQLAGGGTGTDGPASGIEISGQASPTLDETATSQAEPGPVMAYVTGAVNQPGVVELPAGARVQDALAKAGGPLAAADLTVLNLAAVVADGERIYVPLPGETPPPVIGGDSGSSVGNGQSGSGLVNVNLASQEELTALPGIGPVLAGRIVDFRETNGPFGGLGDLAQVSGIGPKLTASLDGLVAF